VRRSQYLKQAKFLSTAVGKYSKDKSGKGWSRDALLRTELITTNSTALNVGVTVHILLVRHVKPRHSVHFIDHHFLGSYQQRITWYVPSSLLLRWKSASVGKYFEHNIDQKHMFMLFCYPSGIGVNEMHSVRMGLALQYLPIQYEQLRVKYIIECVQTGHQVSGKCELSYEKSNNGGIIMKSEQLDAFSTLTFVAKVEILDDDEKGAAAETVASPPPPPPRKAELQEHMIDELLQQVSTLNESLAQLKSYVMDESQNSIYGGGGYGDDTPNIVNVTRQLIVHKHAINQIMGGFYHRAAQPDSPAPNMPGLRKLQPNMPGQNLGDDDEAKLEKKSTLSVQANNDNLDRMDSFDEFLKQENDEGQDIGLPNWICANCQSKNGGNSKFCNQCGAFNLVKQPSYVKGAHVVDTQK